MAKQKSRPQYISQGTGRNMSRDYRERRDISQPREMMLANDRRFDAYISGKRAFVTIPNTGENARREPFKRVLAKEHFNNTLGTSEEGKKGVKDKFLANRQFRMPDRGSAEDAL